MSYRVLDILISSLMSYRVLNILIGSLMSYRGLNILIDSLMSYRVLNIIYILFISFVGQNLTLFVPSDDAFDAAPKDFLNGLLANDTAIASMLLF